MLLCDHFTLPWLLPVGLLLSICHRRHPALPLMCLPGCWLRATWQLATNSSSEGGCWSTGTSI